MKSKLEINKTLDSKKILLRDKAEFVIRKCGLTISQLRALALNISEVVLPIYEEESPNDNRVIDCIQAIRNYSKGKITKDELKQHSDSARVASFACGSPTIGCYAGLSIVNIADSYDGYRNTKDCIGYSTFTACAAATYKPEYQKKILKALKDVFKNK